jgi:flagellar biosynthesis protein FliP
MTSGLGTAALWAAIALVPLVVLTLTSFVKISLVLSLLRNAIGAPDAPSGLVVTGLSLILTFFVMAPVAIDMARAASPSSAQAPRAPASPAPPSTMPPTSPPPPAPTTPTAPSAPAVPFSGDTTPTPTPQTAPIHTAPGETTPAGGGQAAPAMDLDAAIRELVPPAYRRDVDAIARALQPLRGFLARHASARDRETFAALAGRMGRVVRGDELWVLAPAFVTTELREAFAMAVLVFVPFLVVDLVVGLGLAALGLTSTAPQTLALPLKLLLFVSVDGWRMLIDSLLRGYA